MDDRRRGRASSVATWESAPAPPIRTPFPPPVYRLNRTVRGHNRGGEPQTLLDQTAPLANPAGYAD